MTEMHTIVVGVDGSEAAVKAIRFALQEAGSHHAQLKAVMAWSVPPLAYGSTWSVPVYVDDYAKIAETALEKSLEDAGAANSGVIVTKLLRQGQPADILCAEAKGADLLIVGSRGLGGFRGLLLGSVSQQCANHAPCPVVIIPHERGGHAVGA